MTKSDQFKEIVKLKVHLLDNANTYFMWCMRHEMINSTSRRLHFCNHGLYYFAIIILPRTLVKGIKAVSYVVLSHEMYPQGVQAASTLRAIPIKQYPYFAIFIAMDRFKSFSISSSELCAVCWLGIN